jgi:hypothetical protein
VTILPNFVLGPVLGPGIEGVSTGFMKSFLEAPDGKVGWGGGLEGRGGGFGRILPGARAAADVGLHHTAAQRLAAASPRARRARRPRPLRRRLHPPAPPATPQVPSGAWTVCDVRDVAAAHVAAAESPEASGRYIISQPRSFNAK